jgi:hypothetical protein
MLNIGMFYAVFLLRHISSGYTDSCSDQDDMTPALADLLCEQTCSSSLSVSLTTAKMLTVRDDGLQDGP